MPNDNDGPIPLKECTLPGVITVTPPALEFAERFQASIPSGHIVGFNWFDGQKSRASKNAPWIDIGPGLGLGAYRKGDIPEEAIHHAASFPYAVLIREDVVERHPQKTIDLDGPRSVVLK